MKKILLALTLTIVLTGCSVVRIDTNNIDNIVSVVLSKDNSLYNRVGKGFKYYIPREVNYIDTNDLNEKLYSNGNYYYLYVDAIGYYYENDFEFEVNEDAFYSKVITQNEKKGYIEINEYKDRYLVEFIYNYAKIEAYVLEEDINEVILNSSYILSTIKYNKDVIGLSLNEGLFLNKEEVYDVFTSKKSNIFKVTPENDEGGTENE